MHMIHDHVASRVARGRVRNEGSPHQEFLRSPSWSNGRSFFKAIPTELITARVLSLTGLRKGVQGIGHGVSMPIQDFTTRRVRP